MKILILGHYEIASNYAISLVVNALYEQHDIAIMLSGRGDAYEQASATQDKNTFAALALHEQQLCDALNTGVNTLNLQCDSFDAIAKKTQHPIEVLAKPNSQLGLGKIINFAPDLIISIRFRKYLKETLIAIPKHGVINLHSGRLPEYRGAMASFWSMLNGESQIGCVLHFISDVGVDTGNIIEQSTIACDYSKTYLQNVLALYPEGAKNIVKAVQDLALGEICKSYPQPVEGTYYSFPTGENLKEFMSLGHSLFDS